MGLSIVAVGLACFSIGMLVTSLVYQLAFGKLFEQRHDGDDDTSDANQNTNDSDD